MPYKILFFILLNSSFFNVHSINIDDNNSVPLTDEDNIYQGVVYIKSGNTICTGTLINSRTVITAAHCLKEGASATVYFGKDINNPVLEIKSTSTVINPEEKRYANFQGASYDVALISLETPVYEINSYNLSKNIPALQTDVFIAGYGLHGTGLNPDQAFDKKRRVATNNLEISSKEEDVVGTSTLSSSEDKIILGYTFDDLTGVSSEGAISQGDSGGPLLIKKGTEYELIGVASWISDDPINLNNGYGSISGYASIQQNLLWIKGNDPLKNLESLKDGQWESVETWSGSLVPNNYSTARLDLNQTNNFVRYYEVEIFNNIILSSEIELDLLTINDDLGLLNLDLNSKLDILDKVSIAKGSIINKGIFSANSMTIDTGTLSGTGILNINKALNVNSGSVVADGTFSANSMTIDTGTLSGTGSIETITGLNNLSGSISPGNLKNSISSIKIIGDLNQGLSSKIIIDVSPEKVDLLSVTGSTNLKGSLSIKSGTTKKYSGNSQYELIKTNNLTGKFNNFFIEDPSKFGHLIHEVNYENNIVSWVLQNPVYKNLTLSKKGKLVAGSIDSFSRISSKNFQILLDDVNYLPSNAKVDEALSALVPNVKTASLIMLHNLYMDEYQIEEGFFIDYRNINGSLNNNSLNNKIKNLAYRYKEFSVSLGKLTGQISSSLDRDKFNSNAFSFKYEKNLSRLNYSVFFNKIKNDTKTNGTYLIEDSSYLRNKNVKSSSDSFGIKITGLNSMASLDVYYGIEAVYGKLNFNSFKESINNSESHNIYSDINFNKIAPYFLLRKRVDLKNGNLKLSVKFSRHNLSSNNEVFLTKLDKATEYLKMDNPINIDKFDEGSLSVAYTSKNNIYLSLNYQDKGGIKVKSFGFGILIN